MYSRLILIGNLTTAVTLKVYDHSIMTIKPFLPHVYQHQISFFHQNY